MLLNCYIIAVVLCCPQLAESDDIDNEIDELVQEFESRCKKQILHTVVFY